MGKTQGRERTLHVPEKHPHVHGEDVFMHYAVSFGKETPPRAWGRPYITLTDVWEYRNTPTCMGKTSLPPKLSKAQ